MAGQRPALLLAARRAGDLGSPRAGDDAAIFLEATGRARTGQARARVADASGGIKCIVRLVFAEKMEGEAGALVVGLVVARGMGCAVAKKDHAAGFQLHGLGLGLVGLALDVMVAVAVPPVGQERFPRVGHDAQRAVGHGGVVDGDPHGRPAEGLGNLEIGVVLVPGGAHAGPPRLQEDLVEMQRDFGADEFRHGGDDLRRERQRPDEHAVEIGGAELEIDLFAGGRLAVAGHRDVAEKSIALEPGDIRLERRGLLGVEESGHDDVAAAAKLLNLRGEKFHRGKSRTHTKRARGDPSSFGRAGSRASQPGGQVIWRRASRWTCKCGTASLAWGPLLTTSRNPSASWSFLATTPATTNRCPRTLWSAGTASLTRTMSRFGMISRWTGALGSMSCITMQCSSSY